MKKHHADVVPSLFLQQRLKGLVDELGEIAAAEVVCVNRQTLARAAAGFRVHRGTIVLVEQKLLEFVRKKAVTNG